MRALFFTLIYLALVIFFTNGASAADITCGTSVGSGSHTLSANRLSSAGCINITASNVDINCNGFSMSYGTGGVSNSYGINASNVDNITIHNCTIVDVLASGSNKHAFFLSNVSNFEIYNSSVITSIGNAFRVSQISDSTFRNNTITTGYSGSVIFNAAFLIATSADNLSIIDNNITTAGIQNNYGILFPTTNNTLVSGNRIMPSGTGSSGLNVGIALASGNYENNTFENNYIETSGGVNSDGIYLASATIINYLNITNNTVVLNSSASGLKFEGSSNVNLNNNLITGTNTSIGINIQSSSNISSVNDIINETYSWIFVQSGSWANFTNVSFQTQDGMISLTPQIDIGEEINVSQEFLNITYNRAHLNSTNLTLLNVSGQVSLNDITVSNPFPYMDFDDDGVYEQCFAICSIVSFVANVFTFNVAHFTSYRAQENPSPGGPTENTGGGSGPGYDPRFTSTKGIYEAQFGEKPVIGEIVEEGGAVAQEEREEVVEEPVRETLEVEEELEEPEKIEEERADLDQVVEERNVRVQNLIFILIILLVLIVLFFLWKRKKDENSI